MIKNSTATAFESRVERRLNFVLVGIGVSLLVLGITAYVRFGINFLN